MLDKTCPKCGQKQSGEYKYCKDCGYQIKKDLEISKIKCSRCGARLNEEEFCPDCGKKTGIKICPKCHAKTFNENFCTVCGYKLTDVKICFKCGSKINPEARICPSCGTATYKNPFIALILSLVFPGLGQLYNSQKRKAAILIIGYVISWILSLIIIGALLVVLIWIYAMYDGYVSAKAINNGEYLKDSIF